MLLFWSFFFFFYILRFFKQRDHLKYIEENVCLLITQRHKIVAKIIKIKLLSSFGTKTRKIQRLNRLTGDRVTVYIHHS